MKQEYKIVKMYMPSEFELGNENVQWVKMKSTHEDILENLGQDGWEWFQAIGKYWYFKRPNIKKD